jgi:predicted ArsR family transcriptional regulator
MAREHFHQLVTRQGKETKEAIVQTMDALGGLAEVEEHEGRLIVHGYDCPLVAIVSDCPEVCQLTAALLEGLVGTGTVRENCRRSKEAACRFELDLAPIVAATDPPPSIR